jgi:hypothetical protein
MPNISGYTVDSYGQMEGHPQLISLFAARDAGIDKGSNLFHVYQHDGGQVH